MLQLTKDGEIVVLLDMLNTLKQDKGYHEQIASRLEEAVSGGENDIFSRADIDRYRISLNAHLNDLQIIRRQTYAIEDRLLELGMEINQL